MTLNFSSVFNIYKIRTNGVWTTSIPALSISCKKSADSLAGVYELEYPNPKGAAKALFTHFDEQEIWMADLEAATMYRVFKGQINAIDISAGKSTLKIQGRGLSGLLTDRKVNDSWEDKRLDFILCDPTYGCIPGEFSGILTTWNAFTEEYDRFDYWNATRWGAIPAYCTVWEDTGELEIAGDGTPSQMLTGATGYLYAIIEFRLKTTAADSDIYIGFGLDDTSQYILFNLKAAGVDAVAKDGSGTTTEAVGTPPTQTDYNYYRIEWANGEAKFFINGVETNTLTTNVPAITLYPFINLAAVAATVTIDYMKVITITRVMERFTAKNKILTDVVQELCDIGTETESFTFFVDDDYDFNAKVTLSISSGYGFGFNSNIYAAANQKLIDVKLTEEAKDLYNRVRIEGGERLTTVASPAWTEQQIGNGTNKTFALGYKANNPMTLVRVNAVNKIEGTDYTVTYGKEHTIVAFNTAPVNTHVVDFRYDYYTPIIASANNTTSQTDYGVIREYTKIDDTISNTTQAQRLADALLSFYSDPRTVIKATIPLKPQLQIGQTVMIDATYLDISNSSYEIIELEHKIGRGERTTTMMLASDEIETNAEIIREILQQLKDLRTKGDTNTTIVEEYPTEETIELTEAIELDTYYLCDSFVLDHPVDHGKLDYGATLDSFESDVVANWTGADFTEAESIDQYKYGSKSMKLTYTGTGAKTTTTTQSFGDLSAYTGEATGTPSTGALGLWIYLADAAQITTIKTKIGSGPSDYAYYTYTLCASTAGNTQAAGWNYFVAKLESPTSVTGTPAWTATDYATIEITVASGTTLYVDGFTISMSTAADPNRIGANTLDLRMMSTTSDITLTG